jgi:hypothetical protein
VRTRDIHKHHPKKENEIERKRSELQDKRRKKRTKNILSSSAKRQALMAAVLKVRVFLSPWELIGDGQESEQKRLAVAIVSVAALLPRLRGISSKDLVLRRARKYNGVGKWMEEKLGAKYKKEKITLAHLSSTRLDDAYGRSIAPRLHAPVEGAERDSVLCGAVYQVPRGRKLVPLRQPDQQLQSKERRGTAESKQTSKSKYKFKGKQTHK